MLGGIVKGIGSSLAGATADVVGLSTFTSATGVEKPIDKPKAVEPKPFDDEESPTKVLQRILGEVQSIHKVMASQVVPPSEEEEKEGVVVENGGDVSVVMDKVFHFMDYKTYQLDKVSVEVAFLYDVGQVCNYFRTFSLI